MRDARDLDLARDAQPDRNLPRLVEGAQEERREARPPADWRDTFTHRMSVLACLALAWMAAVGVRLVYLHVVQHDELLAKARRQQEGRQVVHAPRGEILDRHGASLAMSVRGYGLEAARNYVEDPEQSAARVCAVLDHCTAEDRRDMARAMRLPRSEKAARYVFLRRQITEDEAARVTGLNDPGVRPVPVQHRYYPAGPIGAHVVGFVDADNVGRTGVEHAMDGRLAGKPGLRISQLTALRNHKRLSTRVLQEPTPGVTVETTLDRELQYFAESALMAAVRDHGAQGGSVIVMDPWTGDVLAMANAPTFDPNRPGDFAPEVRQNRAAQHIYEPGSTFKSFIAAAALDALRLSPARIYDVSAGYVQFGRRRIRDDHRYSLLSFTDVIVKSSNVGAIKIGLQLGPEVVSRYVSRFGFGEVLARDIPHQRSGLVDRNMAQFGPSALASVSMGYQIGVTPLQMLTAVSSIANGGELVVPRVVRATVADGVRSEIPRKIARRTIPPHVAAELTAILEQVVERGTATRARIEGYTIAGKTGTAAKLVGGRYSKSEYNASFVGFLPSRQPRVAIIAVLDSPRRSGYYGGIVAAPLFRAVAEHALRRLGVPPNVNPAPPVLVAEDRPARAAAPVPVHHLGARPSVAPAAVAAAGVMPDLRGASARDALRLLARVGLEARLSGSGVVARQSIAPGTPIEPGAVCRLSLTRDPLPVGLESDDQP